MANLYRLLRLIVEQGSPPPELDLAFYRLVHDDLASMDDAALQEHFMAYGRSEGRISSPAAYRDGLVALVPRDRAVLEIGPFNKPVFRGDNVFYFDVLSREGLVARARIHGQPSEGCPEIDYVSSTGDLSVVDRRFTSIFSSHCIEHQPDLVTHLQSVEKLLENNGRYFMMIPDKRYCFDHYLQESTLTTVLQAHSERRRIHTYQSVYEHAVHTTHNDAARHWAGDHTDPNAHLVDERAERARTDFERANGTYLDVHAWQFTPASFRTLMEGLSAERLTSMVAERIYDTVYGSVEFAAILKKSGSTK